MRNPPTCPGSKRTGQGLANRLALPMHILAFSPQFRWDVVHAHTGSSATCPVLTQRLLVNYLLPALCLPLILLQFKSCRLFIPLYHQLPKAGTSVGRITTNFKEKRGGEGGIGKGKQRCVWTEGQESSAELGCERRARVQGEMSCLPPTHLFCRHDLWRSHRQAFHPGVTPAACSPCEDKDKPNLLRARMAAPALGLPWKPTPAANTPPLLASSNTAPSATPGHCTGSPRLILSGEILTN